MNTSYNITSNVIPISYIKTNKHKNTTWYWGHDQKAIMAFTQCRRKNVIFLFHCDFRGKTFFLHPKILIYVPHPKILIYVKEAISNRQLFQTSLFFQTPRFLTYLERETHCNNLALQKLFWKQHIFGKGDNSLFLKSIQVSVSSKKSYQVLIFWSFSVFFHLGISGRQIFDIIFYLSGFTCLLAPLDSKKIAENREKRGKSGKEREIGKKRQ